MLIIISISNSTTNGKGRRDAPGIVLPRTSTKNAISTIRFRHCL
jgi:hypothetical protein